LSVLIQGRTFVRVQKTFYRFYVDGKLHQSGEALTANTEEDDHEADRKSAKAINHQIHQIVFTRVVNKLEATADNKPKQASHNKGQYQREY